MNGPADRNRCLRCDKVIAVCSPDCRRRCGRHNKRSLQLLATLADYFLFDQRPYADAGRLQWRPSRFLLITFLGVGVLLEVAAMQSHVTIERWYVLEFSMAQITFDRFLFEFLGVRCGRGNTNRRQYIHCVAAAHCRFRLILL